MSARTAHEGLATEGVGVSLGDRRVLQDLTLALSQGWTAIVGPNGAGKSTLLRALAGLRTPDTGTVRLRGRLLSDYTARERAREVAWMGQHSEAGGELTVHEIVHLGRLPHLGLFAAPGARDEALVQQAMQLTECTVWSHRRLGQLSGGERQRVLLACALAVDAPILLLDEPTTHLDPPHQVALARTIRRIAATRTVVTVLHDLSLALHADRLVVMQDGRLVADGPGGDPGVHAALAGVFGHAVRIERVAGGFAAFPRLD